MHWFNEYHFLVSCHQPMYTLYRSICVEQTDISSTLTNEQAI